MNPRRLALLGLFAVLGCMNPQIRSQSDDDPVPEKPPEVRTIGDLTVVTHTESIPVIGVGLVTGLDGTGGGVPPGPERTALEGELKKRGVENIKELFGSKTTSIVRVAAVIPAGARKNETIDLVVKVPEYSRTTSLRNGYLEACYLYNFNNTQNLSPDPNRPDRWLRGHPMVKAEGPVVIGLPTDGDEETASAKSGRVWAGGKIHLNDRSFLLQLNEPSVRITARVAERVNETFHGPGVAAGYKPLAVAHDNTHVVLAVPGAYRLNLARYLRVIRLIPMDGTPGVDQPYCQVMEQQLNDPETTITAALRLEALGAQSIPALKRALKNEEPMVRFAAAEALAYLGNPACGEELARQVVEQPYVQAFALTALASLNEAVCRVRLQDLLAASAPEARYGAFRALRTLDDKDPAVRGEKLSDSFTLHEVAPGSGPLAHVATTKRAEVVLFGSAPRLAPPFSLLAGPEFTLVARAGESTCDVSRFSKQAGTKKKQCSLELADVLRTVAELGGTYADAVDLLRQAASAQAMNCPLRFDALPKAPTVYDLAKAGQKGAPEIDAAPTLFDQPTTVKSTVSEPATKSE